MNKSTYILPIILFTAILLNSCKDDFFVTPALARDTELNYYTNIDNLETATVGCYAVLQSQGLIDHGIIMLTGSIAGDDMEGGGQGPNDSPDLQNIDRFLHEPDHPHIRSIWGYSYKGVYFCNQFLKYFPQLLDDGSLVEEETERLQTRIGEVKFLRSYFYFILTQVFGEVPLLKETMPLDEMEQLGRSPIKEVYEFMESDLKDAIEALPTKDKLDENNIGRASKEAAQALMARLLLYESSYAKYRAGDVRFGNVQQRWDEALSYTEQVIAAPSLKLIGIDGQVFKTFWGDSTNAFRYLHSVDGDNCAESIFEIQSVCKEQGGGWIRERGNSLTKWTSVRQYLNSSNQITDWGWGWIAPTQRLMDIFEAGDPRLSTTIGQAGDSILVGGNDGWSPIVVNQPPYGLVLRKYEASPAQHWDLAAGEWNRGPVNEKLIRLGDVYLMAAEAAFEDGQTDKALEYVNKVRERADMCDGKQDGIPTQFTTVALNDIRDERRRELAGEGFRFFDLVRWGISGQVLNNLPLLNGDLTINYKEGKHEFWPIPQSEVDVLPKVQNYTGW